MAAPLHKPEEVLSFRLAPAWLLFAMAAGCVNATAFMACERFVTHVTGTVTQIGMQFAKLDILLDFTLVLGFFVGGAATAAYAINGRIHRGRAAWHAPPLLAVAVITATVAVLGHAGWLGPFGSLPDEPGDFALLCLLAFASGLQNAAVATTTGLLVRTTHLTGPATDVGIHLVDMTYLRGPERRRVARLAALRTGKMAAFAGGAGLGFLLSRSMQYLAFLVPAAIVGVATAIVVHAAGSADDGDPG